MLIVTTPASDPWLISIEQARVAAGLADTDTSRDAELEILRATVSAQIYDALNIATGNGAEPTIRRETLTQICSPPSFGPLILRRRHKVEVISITGWASDYMVEAEAGLLHSPYPSRRRSCGEGLATIVYEAGFDEVPAALVTAALDMMTIGLESSARDPSVKREIVDVDGVERIEQEFFAESSASAVTAPIPTPILATLRRFRNSVHA